MDLLNYIIDFHKDAERQGPGSEEATKRALEYIPELNEDSIVLDIGCGTGAQTMVLAKNTKANIIAIDKIPQFLEILDHKIQDNDLCHRIETKCLSMEDLPFKEQSIDLIWAEGSIYNIGFEKGLSKWRKFIKNGGYIAVSEVSWLTLSRPSEIEHYWLDAYSEIDTIGNKIAVVEKCGYIPIAHFVLDEHCWTDNYYKPILERSEAFLKKYNYTKEVQEFIRAGVIEAQMYDKYKDFYSYVFYIAKKV